MPSHYTKDEEPELNRTLDGTSPTGTEEILESAIL
jgi:hypothetical protein